MRNRAVWRARSDDPRTALGWALRDAAHTVGLVATRIAWTIRLLAAVVLLRGEFGYAAVILLFSCVPEIVFEAVGIWWSGLKTLPVGALVTLPPPETPFPCRIDVFRGRTLLGSDAAIVTFVDGWLHVEGNRTSFSLRRPDVARRTGERLELAEGGAVAFAPQDRLVVGDLVERGLASRFRANLGSWMRSAAPLGESILPPARPHPSGMVRAWGDLLTSLGVGAAFASALFATHLALVLALSFGWSALVAAGDLRRLARPARALPAVE